MAKNNKNKKRLSASEIENELSLSDLTFYSVDMTDNKSDEPTRKYVLATSLAQVGGLFESKSKLTLDSVRVLGHDESIHISIEAFMVIAAAANRKMNKDMVQPVAVAASA